MLDTGYPVLGNLILDARPEDVEGYRQESSKLKANK